MKLLPDYEILFTFFCTQGSGLLILVGHKAENVSLNIYIVDFNETCEELGSLEEISMW